MRKQAREQHSAEQAIASGAWSQPVLQRLKRGLGTELWQTWLMVALTALGSWALGLQLAYLYVVNFAPLAPEDPALPWDIGPDSFGYGAIGFFLGGTPLTWLAAAGVLPAAVTFISGASYLRQYKSTVQELVHGNAALMLIDEEYSQLVEQAAWPLRWLSPGRVAPGLSFRSRLNHFAHYYAAYIRLSHGPAEVRLPYTMARSCWTEGGLLGYSMVTNCCCLELLLLFPLTWRAITLWPKQLAIKQAVIDFLGGRFDSAWD